MGAEHTITALGAEMGGLRGMVGDLGELSVGQVARVAEAMANPEASSARRIVEREPEADRLEHQIESKVLRMLALRQPVARDLREILAALRIANELERICDHAENIAERITALRAGPTAAAPWPVPMGRYAAEMVADVIDAYKQRDAAKAQIVWQQDRELDEMYSSYFRELLTYMMEDARRLSGCIHLLFMARDLERVGDRATNVAEAVRFLTKGEIVEEERPKADTTRSIVIGAGRQGDTD